MKISAQNNLKDTLKIALQSFLGGCFGCLGAMMTIVIVLLIGGLVFGSIFGSSITQAVNTLFEGVAQAIKGLSSILTGGTGPFSNGQYSVVATPTGTLPQLEVFMTIGDSPDDQRLTVIPQSESTQAYFWVKADESVDVTFRLVLTNPDGTAAQFGTPFTTRTDGTPRNCGRWVTRAPEGNYVLKAMIGNTVVGQLDFLVE